jgi:hypothetical protein
MKRSEVSPETVTEAARTYTLEAVRKLVSLMRNGNDRTAVAAANALLDRGWGKPAQHVIPHEPATRHPSELSDAELERIATSGSAGADPPPPSTH